MLSADTLDVVAKWSLDCSTWMAVQHPHTAHIAVGAQDKKVYVVDATTLKNTADFAGRGDFVRAGDWLDENVVVSGAFDATVKLCVLW